MRVYIYFYTSFILPGKKGKKMWEKVVDVKEAKEQILFSVPMTITNLFYNLIPLVSVMFAGHLGPLQLAGSTLANSWATVTGFCFMVSFLLFFLYFGFSVKKHIKFCFFPSYY